MAERENVEVRKSDESYVRVQCPENVVQILQDSSTGVNRSTWDGLTETLVVKQFNNFNNFNKVKFPGSVRWKTIAKTLNSLGYNFTPEQCRLKIKTVKERCEREKKRQSLGVISEDKSTSQINLDGLGKSDTVETFPENCRIATSTPEALVPAEHAYSTPPADEMIRVTVVKHKSTWNEFTEKLLMEQLKMVDPGKFSRARWTTITEEINSYGHYFTNEQVRLKTKALKEKYLRLEKKIITAPTDPPDASLSNLKTVFSHLHAGSTETNFTIDSGLSKSQLKPTPPDSLPKPNPPNSVPSPIAPDHSVRIRVEKKIEDISDGPSSAKYRRRVRKKQAEVPSCDQLTNIVAMKDYLESLFVRREAAVEKRHQEKMALLGSFIDVLKNSFTNANSDNSNKDHGV